MLPSGSWNVSRIAATTRATPARSAVLCPLAAGGRLLGVLGMEHDEPSHWWHDDLLAVRSVAEALAVALARDHARRALAG